MATQGRELPDETKRHILKLRSWDFSIRQIAWRCDVSPQTVQKVLREAKENQKDSCHLAHENTTN